MSNLLGRGESGHYWVKTVLCCRLRRSLFLQERSKPLIHPGINLLNSRFEIASGEMLIQNYMPVAPIEVFVPHLQMLPELISLRDVKLEDNRSHPICI